MYPISLIYGLIVLIRNKFFDWNIIPSKEFSLPVIAVGNLTVGGQGKTPHIEYIINLLFKDFKVATLSRGYKRKTKGFYLATVDCCYEEIGDEPMQYKTKYPDIPVAVDENRVRGIEQLMENFNDLDVILLDDAFQHRYVKPGINILITDYSKLYIEDYVMPSGKLREFASGSNRADIIIVSKTPRVLSPIDRRRIRSELKPLQYQQIYFSYIDYDKPRNIFTNEKLPNLSDYSVLLVTGIANPTPLLYEIKSKAQNVKHIRFADHHDFTMEDLENIKKEYQNIFRPNKIILTTEKDFMRLKKDNFKQSLEGFPVYYIPIQVKFHGNDKQEFNEQIIKYVTANTKSRKFFESKD